MAAAEGSATVTKIKIGEDNFYLIVTWRDPIIFELVQKDQIWAGKYCKANMEPFYTNLGVSLEKYVEHTKKLMTGDISVDDMIFELKDDYFAWKKIIDKSYEMVFVHGGLNMCHSKTGGTELVADKLLNLKNAAEMRLYNNSDELDNVHTQLKLLAARMDDMIVDKNQMEEDIYKKFLSLLNAKKIKMSELEEFIRGNVINNNTF